MLVSTLHISVAIKRSKNLHIAYCSLAEVNNTPKMPYQISRKLPIVKNMLGCIRRRWHQNFYIIDRLLWTNVWVLSIGHVSHYIFLKLKGIVVCRAINLDLSVVLYAGNYNYSQQIALQQYRECTCKT